MGLLGDGWSDPQSQANMALAAGLLKGNFGEGLLGASNAVQAAKENALKQQYMQAQMANLQSEVDTRKAALAKQQQIFDLLSPKAPAPLSTPVSPGQLGSGSFGAVSPPAGMPAIPSAPAMPPAGGGIFSSMTPEKLALLKANGVDLTDIYKMSREGFERKPGSFYEDWQGRRQYIADPTKGFAYDGQTVTPMPGFLNTQTAMTLATEAPKTLLNAAGKVNLRPNADGTQAPVSELSENPTLQNILGNLFPGQTSAPQPPQMPQSGAAVPGAPRISMTGPVPTIAPNGHPTISPADQKGADAETLALLQQEIRKPGADVAGLQREIDRIQRSQTQPGFPTPSVVRNPQGYGMTTQQAAAAKANEEQAVQQAKDVADQRKAIVNAGFVAPSNIAKYQKIGQLLADVDGGKYTPAGTEFASALNSFGIKIDNNLPNKEAAASLANQAALELRNPASGAGMPGAMSDADRQFLASMTPNMAQSAQGRKMVIDAYIAVQSRNQQVAQFVRKYEAKHGKLDNGFFDQLSAWSSANPLFKAQ